MAAFQSLGGFIATFAVDAPQTDNCTVNHFRYLTLIVLKLDYFCDWVINF